MIRLGIVQCWNVPDNQELDLDAAFFRALDSIQSLGSIGKAAERLDVSYRHLWGLISQWSKAIGLPLVLLERGRGAKLTPFGEKLLWANKRIGARLSPLLDSIASELELELRPMISADDAPVRIHASHGFAVELLRETLVHQAIPHEMQYMGSQAALESMRQGHCDLAGFHVPEGDLQPAAHKHFAQWLQQPDVVLIELAFRQQGLMTAINNPKRLRDIEDLANHGIRFVNRQPGAGTRLVFDMLLAKKGINSTQIAGYDTIEFTHSAVAAFVASGMADAGFGIETGARRFGLHFIPMLEERYFFLCRKAVLDAPRIEAFIAILRDEAFQAKVNGLSGYRAVNCGKTFSPNKIFPKSNRRRAARR